MKIAIFFVILSLILLSGCNRYKDYSAYPKAIPVYTTQSTATTTSTTTSIFDCKSCPEGYICRQNECIKVEYSNIGGGGSSGSGSSY